MQDSQIIETIKFILNKMNDPETGYRSFGNKLHEKGLSGEKYDQAIKDKISEMADKYGMKNALFDEQIFRLTGKDIVENGVSRSCGHAAKAFCYINSQLPKDRRLDVAIMISVRSDHLIDAMECHTLPCVKMSDGKYHALDPQVKMTKSNPNVPFISGEIKKGNIIHHILPAIVAEGNFPYKITKVLSWEEYEAKLSDFSKFLDVASERKGKVKLICGTIKSVLLQRNFSKYENEFQQVYEFCNEIKTKKLPIKVFVYKGTKGNSNKRIVFANLELEGKWYKISLNRNYLFLHLQEDINNFESRSQKFVLEQQLSPSEYMKEYEKYMMMTKNKENTY